MLTATWSEIIIELSKMMGLCIALHGQVTDTDYSKQTNKQTGACVKASGEHFKKNKRTEIFFILNVQLPFINRQPGDFYRLLGFFNEKHSFEWQAEPK